MSIKKHTQEHFYITGDSGAHSLKLNQPRILPLTRDEKGRLRTLYCRVRRRMHRLHPIQSAIYQEMKGAIVTAYSSYGYLSCRGARYQQTARAGIATCARSC